MDYLKKHFITELNSMSFDELCILTNMDVDVARKSKFSCDMLVTFISALFN